MQSGLTHPRTMRLLPSPGGNAQQKVMQRCLTKLPPTTNALINGKLTGYYQVAVGDQEGVLQVFNIKKNNDANHVFKTLPGKKITRMELGGALGED